MSSILYVQDTNCRPGFEKRTHRVALDNGGFASYTFTMDEKLEMPVAHAMKFLKDEAWIVTDEKGNRIRPIEEVRAGQEIPKLGADKVVAYWDELTTRALLIRAQMRRGGEKLSKTTKKVDLIEFLKSDAAVKSKPDDHIDAGADADLVAGEIDGAVLDGMLGPEDEIGQAEAG